MSRYERVFADKLQPGDYCARFEDGTDPYTVLRPAEDCDDLFGRTMIRYWCRCPADDREGWVTLGPHGAVFRLVFDKK